MTAMTEALEPHVAPTTGAISFGAESLESANAKRREQANAQAVELAQCLEMEQRLPTSEERQVLLAYSGLGGTSESTSSTEGNTLGLLNEYYTPLGVARAIYGLLERLRFTNGQALEPSAGTGVFLEGAPSAWQFTAIELNPDAARINQLLHPNTEIRCSSFEHDCHLTGELEFDLVIGNPPFGARGLNTLAAKPQWKSYAPYFADAGLDRLRDGGLLAFVIPSGLMTTPTHLAFRAFLLVRARLRALVRLPVSTFEASGARAATDVVILEKRPWVIGDTLAELVQRFDARVLASAGLLDAVSRDFLQGTFYNSRPECLLGELVEDRRWGGLVCEDELNEITLERLVNTAILETPLGPTSLGALAAKLESSSVFKSLSSSRNSSVRTSLELAWRQARSAGYPNPEGAERADGQVFKFWKEDGRWMRGWRSRVSLPPMIESALDVARVLQELQESRRSEVEKVRLNALEGLTTHLEQHGNPHASLLLKTAARRHPALYRLIGAVRADGLIAPFLSQPRVTTIQRSTDLATVCRKLDAARNLTLKTLLEHWEGGTRDAAREALVENDQWMLTPDGRFTATSTYARGNILEKAALARAQAESEYDFELRQKLLRQAEQLETLKPRKTFEELNLSGTEGWIPVLVIQAWLEEAYSYLEYSRDHSTGRVTVTIDPEKFRTARVNKGQAEEDAKTLSRFFNLQHTAKVVTEAKSLNAEQYAAARKARIEEAQERERALGLKFRHFVAADLALREQLEERYNTLFNGFSLGEDDTRALELSGWAEPTLHGYQNHGVRFADERANALIAFDTGLGKTLTATAIAEIFLEFVRAKRVMIVVPKGLLVNWTRTLERAIPFRQKVAMGISAKMDGSFVEDEIGTVLEKLHEFALGAYEVALISREWFRRLALRSENLQRFICQEASLLAADEVESEDEESTAREKTLTLAERQAMLAARLVQANALPHITFEDLGVDALLVDEAGSLKNLYSAPTFFGKKPKFMGASLESDRAIDMLFKVKWIHANNGARNVIYLTATPTKNSPLELFNILKPLAGETFSSLGIFGPAQFIERYCQIETVLYPNAAGQLEAVPGVVGFKNLMELRGLMGQFILQRSASDVGLVIPELETIEHVFDLSDQQKAIYAQLRLMAQIALDEPNGDHGIHLFSVYAEMRLLTLEPSLYSSSLDFNPRFQEAANIAVEAIKRGGKLVCFMDVGNASEEDESGSRKKRPGLDTFDLLKNTMVHAGVPEEWIALVTADRVKGSRRQAIADDYNAGKLRVIIGSTGTIGEGFDLQVGTTDLIHLDIPWDPGTFHQRNGRGHRQGNDAETVQSHILLARGSFDGLTYAMMRGKRGWQEQLWRSSEDSVRNSAVLSYDEILIALSNDPDAARLEIEAKRADIETQKLEQRRQMSLSQFRLYLETLDHQTLSWQKAQGRKNGATNNDQRLRQNFEQQLERYRQALHDDPAFEHQFLLDGRPCLITSSGVPLGADSVFTLEETQWRVEAVNFRSSDDRKWLNVISLEDGEVQTFQEKDLGNVKDARGVLAISA
jgi:Helicase conserved C-terminal domain/Type III restriction enzyme, res subunit/N-6 DNA Methylase